MPTNQPSLPFRNDTILGVCEALGQDFGFHANWLRIAFALAFYFSPVAVIGTYFGLGLLVAVSRFAYPDRGQQADAPAPVGDAPVAESPDEEQLPLAA
jgi:phage shock protein PspC (stress-responsive transcriptional regulator)